MMTGISYKTEFGSFPPPKKKMFTVILFCLYIFDEGIFKKEKEKKKNRIA